MKWPNEDRIDDMIDKLIKSKSELISILKNSIIEMKQSEIKGKNVI